MRNGLPQVMSIKGKGMTWMQISQILIEYY